MGGFGHFEVSLAWGIPSQVTSSHQDRIQQWSKRYSWRDNHLVQCLLQGDRVVSPPHERLGLIQMVHSELGHFGVYFTTTKKGHIAIQISSQITKKSVSENLQF
jgi:hypothetical protein